MATLVYSDGDGVDRSFALGAEPVVVDRGAECQIRSTDPRVAPHHARFFIEQSVLWIEDLGSSTGIYVGPNKVQRAPVPTGEIILVGSIVMRLLPPSGTLPPPMGLHGILAMLLDLERKTRTAAEHDRDAVGEERDAFAKRVGELHQQLAQVSKATTLREDGIDTPRETMPMPAAEAIRMRDEADAKVAALERTITAMQEEIDGLRNVGRAEWSEKPDTKELASLKNALDEAQAARSIAEHAAGEAARESMTLRTELDELRRQSIADIEAARLEVVKTKEQRMMADTAAGMAVAEKLAEADLVVATLQRELESVKGNVKAAAPIERDVQLQELRELNTVVTGRAEKAEKDLAAAQIRAQGAERNLAHANAQAAKAETRANQVEGKLADAEARAKAAEAKLATATEKITALESRIGAGDAPVQAAEARSQKLAAEVATLTAELQTKTDKIAELEESVADAEKRARGAEDSATNAAMEIAAAADKLADAERQLTALQARVDHLATAESAIAEAARAKQSAGERAAAAEKQASEAHLRAEAAEKRASAADTMAKAMAKDVAEALRRAAEADVRARSVTRELENAHRRADKAEATSSDVVVAIRDAQARATASEAKASELEKTLRAELEAVKAQAAEHVATLERQHAEVTAKLKFEHAAALGKLESEHAAALASTEAELGGKALAIQGELSGKLESVQSELSQKLETAKRELAAERSTALSLVDRKTQLERELAEARQALAEATERADAATSAIDERDQQLEQLHDRVVDLESGLAVSETAQQAALDEARAEIAKLKASLADLERKLAAATKTADAMSTRAASLEAQLHDATEAREAAETALAAARTALDELEGAAAARSEGDLSLQDQLADATARADDAERKLDALEARAEAVDLAIGRAGALQRQLDEAIQKLAWLEREAAKPREAVRNEQSDAILNDRIAGAEARQKEAEARAKDLEARLADADRRLQAANDRGEELVTQVRAGETARTASASAMAELDRRLRDAEARAAEAEARLDGSAQSGNVRELQAQLAAQQQKIAALEGEVSRADNVRSFAAETEREIAQLQRDLREHKARLTQMTLERDRLALEVRDSRSDSETTNERAPIDPRAIARAEANRPNRASTDSEENTANFDVVRVEGMIAKITELERQVIALEKDNKGLVQRIAETEQQLRQAIDAGDDDPESTRTGSQLPIVLAEHVSILEESIDSLRANMRAASDETAVMPQTDSVATIASAVSQAADHVERARKAVRALSRAIGMQS